MKPSLHYLGGIVLALCFLTGAAAQQVAFERMEIDAAPPRNPWIKAVGDLDHDRYPDVIIGGQNGPLVWCRYGSWKRFLIAEGGYDSVDAEAADVDGDDDLDVLVSLMHQGQPPHEVAVHLNIDHGLRWEKQVISEAGSRNIIAADLNDDGKPDILGANHGGDYQPVEWWRNGGATR